MGSNNSTQHINDSMNENVSEKTNVASKQETLQKLNLGNEPYIGADAFIANPYSLLGRVVQIRRSGGKCPNSIDDPDYRFEFTVFPIQNITVDPISVLKEPILRSSIIVDKQLALNVSFLSYLSPAMRRKGRGAIIAMSSWLSRALSTFLRKSPKYQ